MTTVIIQARMGSSRLPGKILEDIEGRPMLAWVVDRVRQADTVDEVLVATTLEPGDDQVFSFLEDSGVPAFRGSQDDVLDRYYRAARFLGADPIVRVTADCPLIDPEVLDRVVRTFHAGDHDYVSNTIQRTYPVGLDVEVFSFAALERAHGEARLASEREHVTPFVWKQPELFRIAQVTQEVDRSDMRWVVDHPQDLTFMRAVYARLADLGGRIRQQHVVELLAREPELAEGNRGIAVDEGYRKSLAEDRELGE